MSEQLKNRTKNFALDLLGLGAGFPQVVETPHATGQVIRSSRSVAANYRSASRGKSKADFISKMGTAEEQADETGFWLEMLRDISEPRDLRIDVQTSHESSRLLDEANQLVAIRHSPFAIRHSSFVIRHSSFVIRHSSFAIRHSSFVIRHSPFAIRHSSFVIDIAPPSDAKLRPRRPRFAPPQPPIPRI